VILALATPTIPPGSVEATRFREGRAVVIRRTSISTGRALLSYSRRDSDYVGRLQQALEQRGKDVWVDVEDIRDGEVFPDALRRAIEGSDAFVFIISPDSVGSPFCEQEVAHARELNKRIVPLAWRAVPEAEIPDEIRYRNWIPVGDGEPFEGGVQRVMAAIETDLEWEREHTRLTVRALEWQAAGRNRSVLLRGSELAAAERWVATGAGKRPGSEPNRAGVRARGTDCRLPPAADAARREPVSHCRRGRVFGLRADLARPGSRRAQRRERAGALIEVAGARR
jgi:hypothetical protein